MSLPKKIGEIDQNEADTSSLAHRSVGQGTADSGRLSNALSWLHAIDLDFFSGYVDYSYLCYFKKIV